jgi:Domain of unknown function (DUF4214)
VPGAVAWPDQLAHLIAAALPDTQHRGRSALPSNLRLLFISAFSSSFHSLNVHPGDAAALLAWKGYVDNGTSLSAVADGFAFSAEFKSTYGNLSNEGFVDLLYHNVLHRAGDAAGLAGWTAALASGQMDRGDVLLGFSESLEHQVNTMGVIDHGILIV